MPARQLEKTRVYIDHSQVQPKSYGSSTAKTGNCYPFHQLESNLQQQNLLLLLLPSVRRFVGKMDVPALHLQHIPFKIAAAIQLE